jgi:hypothetical protein
VVRRLGNLLVIGAVIFAGSFTLQHFGVFHPSPPPGLKLTDLHSVDDLKTRFNADCGHSRLVLILSPT